MLIIPTEKRFDWQHAPITLSFIVLVNCLIFFFYQSGDDAKFFKAIDLYEQEGYFESEWPAFEEFLIRKGETQELDEYRQLYQQQDYGDIVIDLLLREDFYEHLKSHRDDYFYYSQVQTWAAKREAIHRSIQSVSTFRFGLTPSKLNPLTLLTHQFLHGDIMHLLGNMFFLIICGFAVEASVGHLRFLLFYLVSGVAGGALYSAVDLSSSTPLIGASGAISGVMAMYVAAFRFKQIEFFYWFFIFVGYIRAPALLILPLYIGRELYNHFTDVDSNVAYLAHAGGFVSGAILIGVALLLNPKIFNEEYIEEDQSIDPRQDKLAKVYALVEKYRFKTALAALDNLIQEHGTSFELEKLRYHLMRPSRPPGYDDCVLALLKMRHDNDRDLGLINNIWHANPDQQEKLGDDEQLKLALNFTTPKHWATAESIFHTLQARQCKPASLGILARKLSVCFESIGNSAKKAEYARIADNLAMGGVR